MKSLLQAEQKKFSFEADRALTREIVTGVFRHLSHLDWCVGLAASRGIEATRPELMALLRVGLYQILYLERIPVYAAVDQCVEAAKSISQSSAGFVNGILRTAAEHLEEYREAPFLTAGAKGLSLRYGMPLWMVERYLSRIGEEETERMLAALQAPADTALFFPDAAKLAQARPILDQDSFIQRPDPAFPLTLHVSGGNPADSEAFRRGLFYIADPASQVPAMLLPMIPGGVALDLCAAPGGKSVVLSGRAVEGGWVLATDVSRRRIHRIEENVVRMKIENVRVAQVDAGKPLPFEARWNSVLLDAPCSALGTLRRNPEIRWQIKPESLNISAQRQLMMLAHAAAVVAPGGHLLYSVCSLEEEETIAVANAFLAADKQFKAVPLSPPGFLAHLLEDAGTGRAYCLPHRHAWDGFFVALFQRKG